MRCSIVPRVGSSKFLPRRARSEVPDPSLCRRHRRRESSRKRDAVVASAAVEAVYAALSVAATSLTLASAGLDSSFGGREDRSRAAAANDDGASSILSPSLSPSTTSTPPPRPTRPLYVSLTIASFLPYFNFAAFAALGALEKMKEAKRDGSASSPSLVRTLTSSPSTLLAFSAFYALPFAFAGSEGDVHATLAVESLVLGIFHFQAIRAAEEKREEREERERVDDGGGEGDDDGETSTAALFSSLAAAELERFDARLGLKTAKASRLKELAEGAGLLRKKGRRRRGGDEGVGVADVARNKASLAAALAAAATLDDGCVEENSSVGSLDLETREWLTSELAKEATPLVEASKSKRRRRRRKGGALEALETKGEGEL